jgi:hypothetical protein
MHRRIVELVKGRRRRTRAKDVQEKTSKGRSKTIS